MASYSPAKRATAWVGYISLVSQADTKLLKSSPTIAAGDFQVSKDGGALANLTTLPAVTPAASAMVKIDLSATEMTADNVTVVCIDAAGAEWCGFAFNLQPSARQIDDLAYPATSGRSMVVDANGLVDANMVKAGPTGSGTAQTAGDIPALINTVDDFLDTEVAAIKTKTDFLPSITAGAAGGVFIAGTNAATTITTGLTTTFTGNLTGSVGSVTGAVGSVTGAVGSVTGLTASDVGAIKTKTDFLPSATAGAAGGVFIAGTNAATAVNITGNLIGTVSTLTTYTGNTVQTGDSFARIGVAGAGLTNIDLPNQTMDIVGNITGNLSGSVGSVTGAVGSVTGAVGSVTGAVGSVTGNVGGNVTGSVGSVVGLTASNLDATISSRASAANLATVAGYLDTEMAATLAAAVAIKAVTDLLPDAGALSSLALQASVDELEGRLTAARAGYLDNLSAGAVALASGVVLTAAGVDAILDDAVDGSVTWRQSIRLQNAVLAGDWSLLTGVVTYRDLANTKDRLVASVSAAARDVTATDVT